MTESVSKVILGEIASAKEHDGPSVMPQDLNLFGHVKVGLAVQVGHVTLSIDKLMSAKEGDVFSLEQAVDEPVTLLVDQKPIAKANLVAVGDHFGVEIVEIAE